MKKILAILATLLAIVFISGWAYAETPKPITSIEEAEKLAMDRGVEKVEEAYIQDPAGNVVKVRIAYKEWRIAGIGDNGFWTFYTIKYFYKVKVTVLIIYKPEHGAVIIMRKDPSGEGFWYSCYMEYDQSSVVWGLNIPSLEAADGMVATFFGPMANLITDPIWDFIPEPEYRTDACWEIKGRRVNK